MQRPSSSSAAANSNALQNLSTTPLQPAMATAAGSRAREMMQARQHSNEERGLCLIKLLQHCVGAAAAGRLDSVNVALEHIATLASPDGDAMQRVAAVFAEALARRALHPWPRLCRTLRLPREGPTPAESTAARRQFHELCPFLRLGAAAANQCIVESMESEKIVHVVDLGGVDPTQWLELVHLLAAGPDGPPHLRLTAVHEHKDLLSQAAKFLTKEAERLDVPFQFNPIVSRVDSLDVESIRVKSGETVAIICSLQLHCFLAFDNNTATASQNNSRTLATVLSSNTPRMDAFLRALWGLSPKVMVVTEQEASHNIPGFIDRFYAALYYYAALFDSLEAGAPRGSVERSRVEQCLLGEEIKNIVACEGAERRERHERMDRWAARLEASGFARRGLSYYAGLQARRATQGLGREGYKVREEAGCLYLCWNDNAVFSVSAWCRSRKKAVLIDLTAG